MKKVVKGLVATALVASAIPVNSEAQAAENQNNKEQLIIKYNDKTTLSKKEKSALNVETQNTTGDSELVEVSVKDVDQVIEELEASDKVDYVTKNTTYKLAGVENSVNDSYAKNQWNLATIKAEEAWTKTKDDQNAITVAVLDTGVSTQHNDLKNRVKDGATFLKDLADEGVEGAEDDQGHGTFVSGIIAAEANNKAGIAGVAGQSDVKILPVKVMNKAGVGDAYHIAKGIEYATAQKVDVINMSLSGEYNELVEDAVKKANDQGIVVVAAAGNGGGNADASYPAALDHVISVGSVAEKDQAYAGSNVGSTVDLVAPGVNIVSTALNGDLGTSEDDRYTTGTGTSYAAPHVAGVAALYKAKHPHANPAEVEKVLEDTAVDLGEVGRDDQSGYGRVDASAALSDDVLTAKSTFTAPRKNANVMGEIPLEVSLIDPAITEVEFLVDGTSISKVAVNNAKATTQLNTLKYKDGDHEIVAKAMNGSTVVSEIKTSVTVRNEATSGYMFNVLAPNQAIAKGASIQLFEKVDGAYKSVWTGVADANGTARVPSSVGTDLKNLKVVVQGKFTPTNKSEEAGFIYSRDVSSKGSITLQSDQTEEVKLSTKDENGDSLSSQYFVTLKDHEGISVNKMKLINSENGSKNATLYADKGMYNVFSYAKNNGNTYFLSNTDVKVSQSEQLVFDTADAGEVQVDHTDGKLENSVLYIYNDQMTEAIGSETPTGRKFYVTPGEYRYMIDAEVKGKENEENWVYILADYEKKAKVEKGKTTAIKAGGNIDVYPFKGDQEAIKRYADQRGVDYIERSEDMDAYKADQAFYTKQAFQDAYHNELVGMRRGTLENAPDALYKKDVSTGATSVQSGEDWQIETKDFGDLYPQFTVVRNEDGKVMLDSKAKNPTNPANRMYYMYSFFVMTGADYKVGTYNISLKMDENPLMKNGVNETIKMNLKDSGTTMNVKNAAGENVAAYITLNRAETAEDGDIEWTQFYGRNTDTASKDLSIPTNLKLSKEKEGNVAIIRYMIDGRFAYIYKTFNEVEQLDEIQIPNNMTEVKISEMDGENKLDGISSKLWMLKKPMTIAGKKSYVTANNLQVYKYDSVYLEPDQYVIEGNYVSLNKGDEGKDNYYFIEPYEVKENEVNNLIFDKSKLAKIDVEAASEGFSDVRGAIVYPYNEYSDSFVKTLRTGNHFYVPTNLKMNLQVQLGFGDPESKNHIWNYFMTKGEQQFKVGDSTVWKVGGPLETSIKLANQTLEPGAELTGLAEIKDSYNNQLSSIIVNTTNDFTIAEDESTVYKLNGNGQVEEHKVNNEYSIQHSVPVAAANSVKPVVSILDDKDSVVVKNSSLDYYAHIHSLKVPNNTGSYKVQLQIAGSPLGVSTSNEIFNVSTAPTITPSVAIPTANAVSDQSTNVQGVTTPGAKITVKNGSITIGTSVADAKGEYTVGIAKQKAGSNLTIEASLENYTSKEISVVVQDRTAPSITSVSATDRSTKVVVKTEANANLKLVIAGNTYSKTASKTGEAIFTISKPKAGTKWTLTATDDAGNQSTKSGKVLDRTAPKVGSVTAKDNSTKVVVKTEANAKIKLTIAGKTYTKTASKAGYYTFTIKKAKAGTKWSVTVTDAAGNYSTKTGKVLDRTAPTKVKLSKKITTNTKVIIGKAEKNAVITLYKNGKKYRTVKVNSKGNFKITMSKQKFNTTLTFYAKDAAGNKSTAYKVKVKKA